MKVGFGCDHTAIDLKKELMEYMTEKGYECVDYGAYEMGIRDRGYAGAGRHRGKSHERMGDRKRSNSLHTHFPAVHCKYRS